MAIHLIILLHGTSYGQDLCYDTLRERVCSQRLIGHVLCLPVALWTPTSNIKHSLESLQSPSEQKQVRLGCLEEGGQRGFLGEGAFKTGVEDRG